MCIVTIFIKSKAYDSFKAEIAIQDHKYCIVKLLYSMKEGEHYDIRLPQGKITQLLISTLDRGKEVSIMYKENIDLVDYKTFSYKCEYSEQINAIAVFFQ